MARDKLPRIGFSEWTQSLPPTKNLVPGGEQPRMNRRDAIQLTGRTIAGAALLPLATLTAAGHRPLKRPAPAERKFRSEAVETKIGEVKRALGPDTELSWMFENCFPNTLDTTVRCGQLEGKLDTFVITGDIPAMWLRDSTAQVWPYLPLMRNDKPLQQLIAGVINRQTRCILIDPYANAFNFDSEGSEWEHDLTAMKLQLHERKWEIDSLCYPIRLAHGYWRTTGDTAPFDTAWSQAMRLVVKTFREQQRRGGQEPYSFRRNTTTPNDTLNLGGYGNPVKPCGLIASGFRPSDDACIYPFLVPANLFAVTVLRGLAELAKATSYSDVGQEALTLAEEVNQALESSSTALHGEHGKIYAYEVDGFGNQLFMDDANVPSLLSLPYLGCVDASNLTYQSTRRFVLSSDNPFCFKGKAAEGIGGPHVGLNMIWPLSIIMRGLTSADEPEIASCLATLLRTHAGTGFMHESFHKDDPGKFTRAWFAWANTLFGELVLKVLHDHPQVLKRVT
jgi:meiotically up-regulated gene 157 (Mug157) protein